MKEASFYITIEVPWHGIKKNRREIFRNKKTGASYIGKSEKLKDAEKFLTLALRSEANRQKLTKPLIGDIHAIFRFYITNYFTKDNQRSRSIADLSNLIQLPEDCLQEAGVIQNDSDIVCLDGSGRFPGDKNILEIELKLLNDIYAKRDLNWSSKICPTCNLYPRGY